MARVVVAICTANREAYLSRLLRQMADTGALGPTFLELPGSVVDVRVLVVDNRPGGLVPKICQDAARWLPVPVICISEPAPGISEARNRAVIEAIGLGADFIAFLDDDNQPESGWLTALLKRQLAYSADVVVGNRVKARPSNPGSDAAMLDGADDFWKPNGLPELMSTANVLISVSFLKKLLAFSSAFDPRFSPMGGEDADFFVRARALGAIFVGAPASVVRFRTDGARASLEGRVLRKFKAGCAQAHLARRHLSLRRILNWLLVLTGRTLRVLFEAPVRLPFSRARGECLSKIAAALGTWYGFFGGRVRYYTGQGLSE